MNLLDVTTYDEVRALLGVSDEELEDTTLAQPTWATELTLKMADVSPLVETQYVTIRAIAENARTLNQQRFYIIVRLYGSYAIAEELLKSLPLFAYKKVTDGKAEVERVDFFEDIKLGVETGAANMRLRLKQILALIDPSYSLIGRSLPGLMVAVPLGADPVTGT